MRNVRFWVWWNDGLVKLTLRPNKTLRMYHTEQHDEGWSSEHEVYEIGDDGMVYSYSGSDGADCDGRLSMSFIYVCKPGSMQSKYNKHAKVWYPDWQEESACQGDQYAEVMGY